MQDRQKFFNLITATRGSGKSYFIERWLETHMSEYDNIIIFCPSARFDTEYEQFRGIDKVSIISSVNKTVVQQLQQRVEQCRALVMENIREPPLPHPQTGKVKVLTSPNICVIIDDCIDEGIQNFRGCLDPLANIGRHLGVDCWLASQRNSSISRAIRIQTDMNMIFAPRAMNEFEKIVQDFLPKKLRTQEILDIILDELSQQFVFMIMDFKERDSRNRIKFSTTEDYLKGNIWNLHDLITRRNAIKEPAPLIE